jgi:hypothetical protein
MIDNEKFIDKSVENLLSSLDKYSEDLLKKMLKYLAEFDKKDSNLNSSQFDLILGVDKFIRSAVFDTKLDSKIKEYLSTFDKATGNILSINEDFADRTIKVNTDRLLSDNQKFALNNLKGIGFENVTKIIQDILYKGISNNSSVAAVENQLKNTITPTEGVDLLSRHFGQVAQDSLYQYQGEVNQKVIETYNFKAFRYVPMTQVKDTRPICNHIIELGGLIEFKDLETILKEYCPNGNPSKTRETITIRGVDKTMAKGSGMIQGTNIDNFVMNRGGYGCRHSCIGAVK